MKRSASVLFGGKSYELTLTGLKAIEYPEMAEGRRAILRTELVRKIVLEQPRALADLLEGLLPFHYSELEDD